MNAFILWLAQGFGVGRIPFAPGTFGSVVGVGWFALLLASGSPAIFIGGTVLGFFLSVWLCGAGEKILGHTDPGSVVMDEIAAIPLCFWGWLGINYRMNHQLPTCADIFSGGGWVWVVVTFLLFRLFDVWKPWPVRQSQELPGGWGVTVDDFLAALYTNVALLVIFCTWMRFK